MSEDQLDALSSPELHDLAVSYAKRHLDARFFWRLMKVLPAAEAATGNVEEADFDLQRAVAHVDDIGDSGRGEVAEMMRPFYLEYLREHGVTPDGARHHQTRVMLTAPGEVTIAAWTIRAISRSAR